MLTDLLKRIARRKQENSAAIFDDVRSLIVAIGNAELGITKKDWNAQQEENAAALIEASGLTEAEVAASVEAYKSRQQRYKLAANARELTERTQALENEMRAIDEEEAKRRRAFHERMQSLETQFQSLKVERDQANTAEADLIAQAEVSPEERQTIARQQQVNERIAELKAILNPNAMPEAPGLAVNVHRSPNRVLRDCKRELDKIAREKASNWGPAPSSNSEKVKALQERQKVAERVAAEYQAELDAAQKEWSRLQEQLADYASHRILPGNFRLVRHAKKSQNGLQVSQVNA